jgi:hypothetical protein
MIIPVINTHVDPIFIFDRLRCPTMEIVEQMIEETYDIQEYPEYIHFLSIVDVMINGNEHALSFIAKKDDIAEMYEENNYHIYYDFDYKDTCFLEELMEDCPNIFKVFYCEA